MCVFFFEYFSVVEWLTWCTNVDSPRMWYVGGSRPDGAQVAIGRFSSWGTAVPKGN